MKKKFRQNSENRYRIVRYYPTLQHIKYNYRRTFFYSDSYPPFAAGIIRNNEKYKSLDDFISDTPAFINWLWEINDFLEPQYVFGLQNIETGDVLKNFYLGVYTYHPDQGYAILHRHHERDVIFDDAYKTFKLLSLKTGDEIGDDFAEKLSGIKDLCFHGVRATARRDSPLVYEIDEENEILIENDMVSGKVITIDELPVANWRAFESFGIEEIDNGIPYFEDPEFFSAIEQIEQSIKKPD